MFYDFMHAQMFKLMYSIQLIFISQILLIAYAKTYADANHLAEENTVVGATQYSGAKHGEGMC